MPRRFARLAVVPAAAAILCSTSTTIARESPQKPTLEGYPAVGVPSMVTLLAPGAEPRRPIRYAVATGQTERAVMAMDMTIGMVMGDAVSPATDAPTTKITLEIKITDVAANGDISYDLAFVDVAAVGRPGMPQQLVDAVQQASAGLTTVRGSAVVTNRGVNKTARFDTSSADPQIQQMLGSMSQSIQSMSAPLPEEPVGAGARWEVRQAVDSGGTTIFQRIEYEMVTMTDTTATFRMKMDQTAPKQKVELPGVPPGVDVTLQKVTGTGSGTMSFAFNSIVPTAEINAATLTEMLMSSQGKSQPMTVDTKMKMTVTPSRR